MVIGWFTLILNALFGVLSVAVLIFLAVENCHDLEELMKKHGQNLDEKSCEVLRIGESQLLSYNIYLITFSFKFFSSYRSSCDCDWPQHCVCFYWPAVHIRNEAGKNIQMPNWRFLLTDLFVFSAITIKSNRWLFYSHLIPFVPFWMYWSSLLMVSCRDWFMDVFTDTCSCASIRCSTKSGQNLRADRNTSLLGLEGRIVKKRLNLKQRFSFRK